MNPGVLPEIVVSVVFGALTIAAVVLPRVRFRRTVGRGARLVAAAVAAVAVIILWTYTLADAQTTTPSGGKAWCGGSYGSMLDPRLQDFAGLPRECIVHSWIAVVVLLALAIMVLLAQHCALRLVVRRRGGRTRQRDAA